MPESNVELININNFQDIENYFDKLTRGENVAIGDISETITIAIKLDGGRFVDYEAPYVDAVIANMILAHQESYKKIVKQLRKDYSVTDLDEEILLQFRLEQGCCEAELKEFNNILETIKTMEPQMQVLTIGAILLGLFGFGAYKLIKQRLEDNKQIALAQMQNNYNLQNQAEQNRNTEAIVSTIEKITKDYKIEKAVNHSKEKTLKMLNIDETLSYDRNGVRSKQVTKNQIDNYDVEIELNEQEEIESIEQIVVQVATINYTSEEKMVKMVGNSQLFSRDMLPVQDRVTLARRADNNERMTVEVKFFKDQNGKILRAYLLRIVD